MTHACALRLKSTWRQRYKVILKVTLFLYLLREVYLTDMQRLLLNFAQTFCSTASTMKFLFAISLVSVCLFLVTARFVHFIHRQEIVEDVNSRDDPGVTGLFDMPSRSSSKIHIASCRHFGMLCTHDRQCCSHHCGFPCCLWRLIPCGNHRRKHKWHLIAFINKKKLLLEIFKWNQWFH